MSTTSTKNQLLHEASRMLLSKGLNGFGLQELATKLNIKKSSLFHHYPSKLAIALELYRYYQSSFTAWATLHEHLTPEKQILSYGQKLTSWICEKERVCPVGALSLEWTLVDAKLKKEIKGLHDLHREWLTQLFKKIHKKSGLRLSVNEAVLTTMGLIQGSIQLARIHGDTELVNKNLKSHLKCIKEKS